MNIIVMVWGAILLGALIYVCWPKKKPPILGDEQRRKLSSVNDTMQIIYRNITAHLASGDKQILALHNDELIAGVVQLMLEERLLTEQIIAPQLGQPAPKSPEDEFESTIAYSKKVTYH